MSSPREASREVPGPDRKRKGFCLPADVVTKYLLRHLSPLELIRFSLTNKANVASVTAYMQEEFSIDKVLGRYFTSEEIEDFRYLQADTGMLISGSTALQFFNRIYYPESDLDLYVNHNEVEEVTMWLEDVGYELYQKKKKEGKPVKPVKPGKAKSREDTLAKMDSWSREFESRTFEPAEQGYARRPIVKVHNYRRMEDEERYIQVIETYTRPLRLILSFHSTCVMNIITHDAAYSLFPHATFEKRQSLVIEQSTDYAALDKYRQRGWKILAKVPPPNLSNPKSDFYSPPNQGLDSRYVGDKRCWKVPLHPKLDLDSDSDREKGKIKYYTNPWQLRHEQQLESKVKSYITSQTEASLKARRRNAFARPVSVQRAGQPQVGKKSKKRNGRGGKTNARGRAGSSSSGGWASSVGRHMSLFQFYH